MTSATQTHERDGLALLAKTAEMLLHPLRFVHDDHLAPFRGEISGDQLNALCKSNDMQSNLNRTYAKQLGTVETSFEANTIYGYQSAQPLRDVFALVTASSADIENFLRQATAVCLHNAIRNCVLKADRERVRSSLGDQAYDLAIREAPLFYAGIASHQLQDYFSKDQNEDAPILAIGATTTHQYIAALDAGLAQLFAWRLPENLKTTGTPLSAAAIKSFARLLNAKGPV